MTLLGALVVLLHLRHRNLDFIHRYIRTRPVWDQKKIGLGLDLKNLVLFSSQDKCNRHLSPTQKTSTFRRIVGPHFLTVDKSQQRYEVSHAHPPSTSRLGAFRLTGRRQKIFPGYILSPTDRQVRRTCQYLSTTICSRKKVFACDLLSC